MGYPNTIVLIGKEKDRHDEGGTGVATTPGMLVELTSANLYQPHSSIGGDGAAAFAKEDSLQGKTIDDAYQPVDGDVPADLMFVHLAQKGDVIYAILQAGQSVVENDSLISAGNGKMVKAHTLTYALASPPAALANSTVETVMGTFSVPGNVFQPGDIVRVEALANFPSTNGTDTFNLKLNIAGTNVFATGAVDVANNDAARIVGEITIRTTGPTGTFVGEGSTSIGTPGTATDKIASKVTTAIDTGNAVVFNANGLWSVANTTDQAVLQSLNITIRRAGGGTERVYGKVVAGTGGEAAAVDLSSGGVDGRVRLRVI